MTQNEFGQLPLGSPEGEEPEVSIPEGFARDLLGWKASRKNKLDWDLVPNCADIDSAASLRLSAAMLEALGIEHRVDQRIPTSPGGPLENKTRDDLAVFLPEFAPNRQWRVQNGQTIWNFAQYAHLHELHRLVSDQPELRVTIGQDYLIKPDVTVAILDHPDDPRPFLHGVVSCKWTIRSDRVQNIRHEYGQMIRHRRGRMPHLVTLTAEPLPSRLASIARGTGEVDCTYHIAWAALNEAVLDAGSPEQKDAWYECVNQERLRPYFDLPKTLGLR